MSIYSFELNQYSNSILEIEPKTPENWFKFYELMCKVLAENDDAEFKRILGKIKERYESKYKDIANLSKEEVNLAKSISTVLHLIGAYAVQNMYYDKIKYLTSLRVKTEAGSLPLLEHIKAVIDNNSLSFFNPVEETVKFVNEHVGLEFLHIGEETLWEDLVALHYLLFIIETETGRELKYSRPVDGSYYKLKNLLSEKIKSDKNFKQSIVI